MQAINNSEGSGAPSCWTVVSLKKRIASGLTHVPQLSPSWLSSSGFASSGLILPIFTQ